MSIGANDDGRCRVLRAGSQSVRIAALLCSDLVVLRFVLSVQKSVHKNVERRQDGFMRRREEGRGKAAWM